MRRPAGLDAPLALAAGVVLAVMIDWNSALARYASPLLASWIAHGVGVAAGMLLVVLSGRLRGGKPPAVKAPAASGQRRWPPWIYAGGIPGALTVLLAAVTVNGPLGLAGTLALMLAGQMLFGLAADRFGLLGLARRQLGSRDLASLGLVLAGSAAVILSRA